MTRARWMWIALTCGAAVALSGSGAATQERAEHATPQAGEQTTNTVGMRMAFVPQGEFAMGSAADEAGREFDEARHVVKISQSFRIGVTEVTQAQWTAVMGKRQGAFEGADRPVESVSWKDAVAFCEKLSKLEGRTYRLPSEAEWEYVCRAGVAGQDVAAQDLSERAWFDANAEGATHDVGRKKPNAWGIHDMHGNVAEWCGDVYDALYPTGAQTDPTGPPEGTARVTRGGSFGSLTPGCRAAARSSLPESYALKFVGFRVVSPEPAALPSSDLQPRSESP